MYTFLKFVHLLVAVAIVLLVLVQRGKGAEAGAGFGAGASGTVFGARGAGNALSRATAILVAIFMVTSLSLTYLAAHPATATATQQDSALDRLAAPAAQPGTAPEGGQAPAGAPAPVAPTSK